MSEQEKKRNRRIGIAVTVAAIGVLAAVSVIVIQPMLDMVSEPERLREYVAERGLPGILVFSLMVALQVVAAVVPGGPFEVAAGYAFGAWKGALICDLAMTLASVGVFLLTKRFGMRFLSLFVGKEELDSVKFLKMDGKKEAIIFLLFLIPGTPKDLLSYAAGLTDMGLPAWVFICAAGRFPSILLSAMSGSAAGESRFGVFAGVLLGIALLSLIGFFVYRKVNKDGSGS